jgi:type II secretory pathway pseudopilin PulG
MKTQPRIVTTILIIIGLVCSAAVARAQSSEEKIIELQATIVRLEAKIAALEEAAKKAATAPAPAVAAKRWTVPEIKAACSGKTTAEVKALLGPPDQIKNTLWGYEHLVITDPDSGVDLNFLVLEFVGGKARISQLRKG